MRALADARLPPRAALTVVTEPLPVGREESVRALLRRLQRQGDAETVGRTRGTRYVRRARAEAGGAERA